MTNEIEESATMSSDTSWCRKIFRYVKNRNRIGPGKIELADCDFFIVGPRRTLRVLVPLPRGNVYYETTRNERPETIDENFVSRWASRPHSSGNCRCSFGQTKNRLITKDERMISEEIERIRTSLCEAEKSGEDIDELEQRIALNLEALVKTDLSSRHKETNDEINEQFTDIPNLPSVGNDSRGANDALAKDKIVKDLEEYIDRLLQEVLTDTMKFFNDAGDTLKKSHEVLNKCRETVSTDHKYRECRDTPESAKSSSVTIESVLPTVDNDAMILHDSTNSFAINFVFHENTMNVASNESTKDLEDLGYDNRGFAGSANDPDSLDFHLQKSSLPNDRDILDCTDSGINSVETMEFQIVQEPSLEESLMKIIDAKFGRTSSRRSAKNLRPSGRKVDDSVVKNCSIIVDNNGITCGNDETAVLSAGKEEKNVKTNSIIEPEEKPNLTIESVEETARVNERINDRSMINFETRSSAESLMELEETGEQQNFDKLRLELLQTTNTTKKINPIEALREKFTWKFPSGCRIRDEKRGGADKMRNEVTKSEEIDASPVVELRVKNDKVWRDNRDDEHVDIVKFRKFRKPTIVFLHGFGSSAEIFENQLEYFTNLGYPCIAPELLGHGMSSAPDRSRDYHFDKLLNDLETILQHYAFGPGKKCVLVAHNYGCSFATALACKYDSNIHQLVLISGGGPTPLAPPSTEGAGHCCLRAMLTPLLMCGLHRDILYSARGRQHPYCGPEPAEQRPSHMKYILDGMVWPEGDYVFHRRICTPTLLIHGLRDDKVSLVQECQMERTIIKAFLDAIPTAGHTPMTDCPEQVNHMIHCFVDLWKRKRR